MGAESAMEAEFDTIAGWTASVVSDLGAEYAIPAACRGSGSPAALDWLARSLHLGPEVTLLDAGAGVGGPAAFVRQRYGLTPVLAEPMHSACSAAVRLFGLPVVAATVQELPFASGTFDTAWCLGVLCTTASKLAALTELRRVLRPEGRLGLLVFIQVRDELPEAPEGNSFPTEASLAKLLGTAGFDVHDSVELAALPSAPRSWQARVDRVESAIEARYGSDPRWVEAHDQQQRIGALLADGEVIGRMVIAQSVSNRP